MSEYLRAEREANQFLHNLWNQSPAQIMTESEKINMFIEDVEKRIDYHRAENQLTYAAALGCLDMIMDNLRREMREDQSD